MNFSTDRDLLALEPGVFLDVPFAAQQRVSVSDGVLTGTTLTSAEADFEAAQVESGHVVLINRLAHEVIERVDAGTLTVSLLRARATGPAIPGAEGTGLSVKVRSFAAQAALVHDELLRLLGIDPDDPEAVLDEDAVVSLSMMAQLEALGTLERVYTGAAALVGDNETVSRKAQHYRRRFREALAQATVLIDTDGDGRANERRHFGLVRLLRV